jgi:predicted RNase H-like HicB family nuclease
MLDPVGDEPRSCDGVSRRNFLKAGSQALGGLTLPGLLCLHAQAREKDTSGRSVRRYVIVVMKWESRYLALVPDLPGCVAVGATIEETKRHLRDAIEVHLQRLRADGLPVPEPSSVVDYVEVSA